MIQKLRKGVEIRVFGVCAWLGEKLQMKSSSIRLFFIYSSCLTLGSPLLIYLAMAFILKLKYLVFNRRTSVFDL